MIDRKQIGFRISVLRKKAGLSQAELADKLSISAQAVSKWENGKNLPDIDLFCELAWLFNTTVDQLIRSELFFGEHLEKKRITGKCESAFQEYGKPEAFGKPCAVLLKFGALQCCKRDGRHEPKAILCRKH